MKRPLLLLGVLVPFASPAVADDHAIGLKIGALGLGVEYSYDFTERLTVRAGLNGSQIGFDDEEGGIQYDFDIVWDSLALGVDFHPLKSPFRLSLGVLSNDNRLEAESRPTQNVTVGDTTYTPAQVGTLTGRIGFEDTAPYLGVGWDWSRKDGGFGMALDLGVLDQGAPAVSLRGSGTLLGDPAFQQDIAAEEAELRDSLDLPDVVPYLTLGFQFRF
jgi:hypothetical protein